MRGSVTGLTHEIDVYVVLVVVAVCSLIFVAVGLCGAVPVVETACAVVEGALGDGLGDWVEAGGAVD